MRDGAVVVTGASGFVGSALCADLLARGARVRAVVRDARRAPAGTDPVVVGDLDDAPALRRAMHGAEAVVHLAARVHVMDARTDDAAAYSRTNVEGTRTLLDAAQAAGVPRFVFASSVKAVGEWSDAPWTERTPPRPQDAYGRSKLAAEALVREAQARGLHAPILRLPLVYGPGVRGNLLRLLGALHRGRPLPFGALRNRRSLLALPNLVAAVRAVLDAPAAGAETLFVSDDHDVSSAELCRLLAAGLGRPPRLVPLPAGALLALGRVGDVLRRAVPVPFDSAAAQRLTGSLQVDVSRLRRVAGWRPLLTPAEGLAETGAWYRREVAA